MKTIKEIADKIGVSKTAVSKKIDKLGLRQQLTQVDGAWLISESVEKTLLSSFDTNKQVDTTDLRLVSSVVDTLKEQLAAKDRQIEHLHQLLDHEQQMRMLAEQKLIAAAEEPPQDVETPRRWWQFWRT